MPQCSRYESARKRTCCSDELEVTAVEFGDQSSSLLHDGGPLVELVVPTGRQPIFTTPGTRRVVGPLRGHLARGLELRNVLYT